MDGVRETESSCAGEISQISDVENDSDNPDVVDTPAEEIPEEIVDKDEYVRDADDGASSERDGGESDVEVAEERRLTQTQTTALIDAESEWDQEIVIASAPQNLSTGGDSDLSPIFMSGGSVNLDEDIDCITEIFSKQEAAELSGSKTGDDDEDDDDSDLNTFVHQVDVAENEGSLYKEASAQTMDDAFIASTDPCPMCNSQRQGMNNLKALCLEYPSYKKRKVMGIGIVTKSDSRLSFDDPDDSYEEGDGIELKRKRASSDDQVVPRIPSQTGPSDSETSSSRSIRIGLSKRAKLRPLHPTAKLCVNNTSDNAES